MKKALKLVCFFLIGIMIFLVAGKLLQPVWQTTNHYYTFDDFYKQPKDTIETLFLGASIVPCGINPTQLYRDYGLCSYNLGTEAQPVMGSYYLLKEAYRLHPKSLKNVVLEVSLLTKKVVRAAYHKPLDWMRMSGVKLEGMIDSALLFDESLFEQTSIGAYHDRWSALERLDFFALMHRLKSKGTRGYYGRFFMQETTYLKDETPEDEYYFPDCVLDRTAEPAELEEEAVSYFDRILEFCRAHGLSLVLYRSPANNWDSSMHNAVEKLGKANNLTFFDFNFAPLWDEIKIYPLVDTLDSMHLNYYGARKLTDWFGRYLTRECGASDVRGKPGYEILEQENALFENNFVIQSDLRVTDDPAAYIARAAAGTNIAVFIMAKEEAGQALTDAQRAAFADMGLNQLAHLGYRDSYMAVICDGQVRFESIGDGPDPGLEEDPEQDIELVYTGTLPSGQMYELHSSGTKARGKASCKIGGVEYAKKERGLNIVVYNYDTDTVLDSCVFDTHEASARNADYFLRAQALLDDDAVDLDALDEDTKRVYQYCQRCRDNELIQLARADLTDADMLKYLRQFMNDGRFVVYLTTIGDGAKGLTEQVRQRLAEWGVKELSLLDYLNSYIGIIDGGKVIFEQRGAFETAISISCFEGQYVTSGVTDAGNAASVQIDDRQYCPFGNGLNIVVYDKTLKQVIDAISFDIGAVEQRVPAQEVMAS